MSFFYKKELRIPEEKIVTKYLFPFKAYTKRYEEVEKKQAIPPFYKYFFKNCLVTFHGVVIFPWVFKLGILRVNWIVQIKYLILHWFFTKTVKLNSNRKLVKVRSGYGANYYHWVTEALPVMLDQVKDREVDLMIPPDGNKYYTESLELLNFRNIVSIEGRYNVWAKEFETFSWNPGIHVHPWMIRNFTEYIRDIVTPANPPVKKIYVSRQKAPKRKISNYMEVERLIEESGFRTIYCEELTFAEQVALFHSCDIVLGVHGAGLTNIMFMKPGSKVIEFIYEDQSNSLQTHFCRLSDILQHEYQYLFCKPSGSDDAHLSDIQIDLQQLEQVIQST